MYQFLKSTVHIVIRFIQIWPTTLCLQWRRSIFSHFLGVFPSGKHCCISVTTVCNLLFKVQKVSHQFLVITFLRYVSLIHTTSVVIKPRYSTCGPQRSHYYLKCLLRLTCILLLAVVSCQIPFISFSRTCGIHIALTLVVNYGLCYVLLSLHIMSDWLFGCFHCRIACLL